MRRRVYTEYVAAKQALGENVSNIPKTASISACPGAPRRWPRSTVAAWFASR